jgi:large subunit ribosomal protein L3
MKRLIWGRKIGMTQFFSDVDYSAIPVTVIDLNFWYILFKKNSPNDGHNSIQIGSLKKKFWGKDFSSDWLSERKKYFSSIKEINKLNSKEIEKFKIGDVFKGDDFISDNEKIIITGTTIGKGFQGVVKRYGFKGGRASHGDKLGRKPGSLCGLRTQGHVFKGKKMPGRDGGETKTIKNIRIIKFDKIKNILIVKGAVPGKSGSLICISKEK